MEIKMVRNDWTFEEIKTIYTLPLMDLIRKASQVHQEFHSNNEIQLCSLLSIKTGGCSEDCAYCPQSSSNQTDVEASPLMAKENVLSFARQAKEKGSTRICLGAAWKQVRDSNQFDRVLEMVKEINEMGLEVCATLGMLTKEQALKLKAAGLYAYNHNLDTSERYYKQIITTRSYQDRLNTLQNARNANITLCCGGIIGMGETEDDRIELIKTLSTMDPHPESVPINRLIAIKGTPLQDKKEVPVWDLIRAIATARITMPNSMVRLSAGRETLSFADQALCFLAGANSIFYGEKLLTAPNSTQDADSQLIETLQLKKRAPFKAKNEELTLV
jgi:biotin synthase